MKTFGDFLTSAKLEKKAGIESFDDDARKPLDEQLRLGSVAGPLVCTTGNKKEATFKLHPSIPFDWGKLKTDGTVHPVKHGEVIRYHAYPPKGTLSPAGAPNTLRKSYFRDPDFNLSPGTTYLFEESHFDGVDQIIDILSACDPAASWPAGLPEKPFPTAPSKAPAEERALAACLDDRNPVFAVKGPPGTGKTDLLAEVALKLAQAGKKVGIITVSHDAVNNALARASVKLRTGPSALTLHKHGKDDHGIAGVAAGKLGDSELPAIWGGVLAAASQMFEKDKNKNLILNFKHGTCDVLLLDEAGQIPAYEAAALSHLAGRMIFFGDEDQLPNITKGSHPPGSHGDSSAMQYLRQALGPEWTIPLETSHRMNSTLCDLIQHHFYSEIALTAGKNTAAHLLETGTPFPSLVKDAFRHTSPRLSRSQEEVTRVVAWVKRLLAMQVVLENEAPRPMTTGDIAILTPFRTQASAIRQAIDKDAAIPAPEKLRIGTVDKMQGQGAAAVIYSMASSSKDYIANQAEWLFSPNRWNVAISRAHACAIVLGDMEAHLNAEPKSLDGIAAQQKIREVMENQSWTVDHPTFLDLIYSTPKESDSKTQEISILSWNLGLRAINRKHWWSWFLNELHDERMGFASKGWPDVICLQEILTKQPSGSTNCITIDQIGVLAKDRGYKTYKCKEGYILDNSLINLMTLIKIDSFDAKITSQKIINYNQYHFALSTCLSRNGREMTIFNCHLKADSKTEISKEVRHHQANHLIEKVNLRQNVVLIGDFNCNEPKELFADLAFLPDKDTYYWKGDGTIQSNKLDFVSVKGD